MQAVTLPDLCDRTAARSTHTELCEALGDAAVQVDAGKVEKLGQAMIQVLLAASRSEGGITLVSPSEAFVSALGFAGLEHQLIGVS